MTLLQTALFILVWSLALLIGLTMSFIIACILVGVVRTVKAHLGTGREERTEEEQPRCALCVASVDEHFEALPPLIFHDLLNARHDAIRLSDRDEQTWASILNGLDPGRVPYIKGKDGDG